MVVVDEQDPDRLGIVGTQRFIPPMRVAAPARSADRTPTIPRTDAGRDNRPMRIALLGLGLIGGSIARALRADPGALGPVERLAAWSPSGTGPGAALTGGVIDAAPEGLEAAIGEADLVVLAAPPTECLELIRLLGGLRGDSRPAPS